MRRLGIPIFLLAGLLILPVPALADSISPTDFSKTLFVGDSYTLLGKTVTVSAGPPTSAQTDVFLLATEIDAAIEAAFATYSTVGIEAPDLAGLDITVVPTSFSGAFDRSIERTFSFDVTFTGLAEGTYDFILYGLVDGGRIAEEHDVITVTRSVPEPGTLLLMGSGLLGLGLIRRFMK